MKHKIVSILTALALCLSLWPGTALAAGGMLPELNLDEEKSKVEESTYTWEPVRDTDSNITSGTLTLADGFKAEKVILPDARVEIITNGNCEIDTLTTGNYESSGSANIQLTFSGNGPLTIEKHIELSGSDHNTLTVAAGATVTANNGITIGASGGVNSIVTVNGTLTIEQGSGVAAVSAGKVTIGQTGHLQVNGQRGVMANGTPQETGNEFTGAFTITKGGTFEADCSEYNIIVSSGVDKGFESTPKEDFQKIIQLDESYWPSNYEVKKDTSNQIITFAEPETDVTYNNATYQYEGAAWGPFALHERHVFPDSWSIDKNEHWHACTYAGCGKRADAGVHTFGTNGVCTTCGAKLEVNLTGTDNLVYDGTAKEPHVTVRMETILTQNTDYTVSYADNTNAGTGTVTVAGSGNTWKVEKTFTIKPAPLTISTVTAADKTYDGTDTANVTVTFTGLKKGDMLTANTDYTVNGKFENANAGGNKQVSGTVTLLSSSNTAKNYTLSDSSFSTTGKIEKATVSGATQQNLNIANHLASTYTFLLSNLRPTINGQWGTVEYEIKNVDFTGHDGYYKGGAQIIADDNGALNTLSLPILQNEVTTTGHVGTVTVTVKSTNYENFENTINIMAGNKKRVTFGGVTGVTTVYNGQPVAGYTGTLTITDSDGKPVDLTPEIRYTGRSSTSWDHATVQPTNAGTYAVVFRVPDDNPDYIGRWNVEFEITPATVTITADNKSAYVGSAMPTPTYTVTGLVRPDTLTTEPTLTCSADMSRAGSYPITASGAAVPSSGNYNPAITYIPGTLTVETPYVPPVHSHYWSTDWTSDDTYHWHRCLNGCSQRDSLAEHVFDDEWDTDCNTCGYVREVEHRHIWDEAWSHDASHHWHECTAPGCDITDNSLKDGYAEHVFDDDLDTDCNTCGYVREVAPPEHVHAWAEAWSQDDTHHWHACLADGCTITSDSGKDGYGVHVYDDERDPDCNVCGYERAVEPPPHVHDWDSAWSGDDTHHWHECLAGGCGITADSEKDGYGGHIPGMWITGYPAASATTGQRYRACTVCGRILETETIPAAGGSQSSGGGSSGGSAKRYAITVEESAYGTVISSRASASRGTKITLAVTPEAGYALLDLTVTDSQGNPVSLTDQNAFIMPGRDVTVKAAFAPVREENREQPCGGGAACPSGAYADLSTGAWYHEAVDYAIREGLLTGYGDGTFRPNGSLSRAQLAQILYNRADRPGVTAGGGFADVPPDSWYADAVAWAAAQGIAGGYSNGTFGPNDPITREQLAVMLWRYHQQPAAAGRELPFSDANQAGSWALDALRWAVENGILNGRGDGILDPTGLTSRAEAAQMLKNCADTAF